MNPYQQAQFIARRRQQEQQRAQILQALMSDSVPMNAVLDPRLPLSDQERANIWNQRAANQHSAQQASLQGANYTSSGVIPKGDNPAISGLVQDYTRGGDPFVGTDNQMRASMALLSRDPSWQTLDEKGRASALQRIYGTEAASKYQSALLDQETVDKQRRQTFNDKYETDRMIERENRQSANRYGNTELEKLHRDLIDNNVVLRPEGIFEKNPKFRAGDITSQELQYIPAGPATEQSIAANWDRVMPGRPNPLAPQKQLAFQLSKQNPDWSNEQVMNEVKAKMAALTPQPPRPMMGDLQQAQATPVLPPQLRMGQRINNFVSSAGTNMLQGMSQVLPSLESHLTNIGQTIENNPTLGAGQFISDLFGRNTPMAAPAPINPITPTETNTYQAYPDWLKNIYNAPDAFAR